MRLHASKARAAEGSKKHRFRKPREGHERIRHGQDGVQFLHHVVVFFHPNGCCLLLPADGGSFFFCFFFVKVNSPRSSRSWSTWRSCLYPATISSVSGRRPPRLISPFSLLMCSFARACLFCVVCAFIPRSVWSCSMNPPSLLFPALSTVGDGEQQGRCRRGCGSSLASKWWRFRATVSQVSGACIFVSPVAWGARPPTPLTRGQNVSSPTPC